MRFRFRHLYVLLSRLMAAAAFGLDIAALWCLRLPFCNETSFGQSVLGSWPPLLLFLLLPAAAGICALLSARRPCWSLATGVLILAAGVWVEFSKAIEDCLFAFTSPWIGGIHSEWGIAYTVMSGYVNTLFYASLAFIAFSIAMAVQTFRRGSGRPPGAPASCAPPSDTSSAADPLPVLHHLSEKETRS